MGYVLDVPELAALLAFAFLVSLLVYVILQVPLIADEPDALELWEADRDDRFVFQARFVLVSPQVSTVVVDGVTFDTGEPFALEIRQPEGWSLADACAQLHEWATTGTIVVVTLRDDVRGARAWVSSGDQAMDSPLTSALGVQSAR